MSNLRFLDPVPVRLVPYDWFPLTNATEILSDPLSVWWPSPPLRQSCNYVEVTVDILGNLQTVNSDLTLNVYRCPPVENRAPAAATDRDVIAASATTIASSGGANLGTDEVATGGFGADSDWHKGNGWSIGSGVATHDAAGGRSPLIQTLGDFAGGKYLFQVKINSLGTGALVFAHLTSTSGNVILLKQVTTALKHGSLVTLPTFAVAAGLSAQLRIEADGDAVIDDVKLQPVTPYRRTLIFKAEDLGAAAVFGFKPVGDMATSQCYIRALARRVQELH